ncbi:MAG TPA: DUF3151 domain-containing protein [Acidimicrobiales bacterium]|nr:DUF3151 domain-containing protein [Acidimicrobiales bacterium]
MPDPISLGAAPPETVLPAAPDEAVVALAAALASGRREAVAAVAARWPRYLECWAELAELELSGGSPVTAYAFARTGYHRGLDALRASGWRGSGFVLWRHPSNRGFLRSLVALSRAAGEIGERDEERRCELFLRQLDPGTDWSGPRPGPAGADASRPGGPEPAI